MLKPGVGGTGDDDMIVIEHGARGRVYRALEVGIAGRGAARWIHASIIVLIVANVVAVIMESNRALAVEWGPWFRGFEVFSVCVFTVEYVLRNWAIVESDHYGPMGPIRGRVRFALSPMSLVDLLAILPFYLSVLIPVDLRFVRVLRLLRLLKLAHYFSGLNVFLRVLRVQLPALAAAFLVMIVMVLFAAILMFMLENESQPDRFQNIGDAIWWSVVTLTTVGYGDSVPVTAAGKVLGVVIMLLGVGTVALPAALLAARFSDEIQRRRDELADQIADFMGDGWMTTVEREEVDRLGRELGLSDAAIQRMVERNRRRGPEAETCPHCGRDLAPGPTPRE